MFYKEKAFQETAIGKIPNDWQVKSLEAIGKAQDGDWILKEHYAHDGVRLLQIGDIGIGHFVGKSNRFISCQKAAELKCTFVKPNEDILISRMPEPVGRACIAPNLPYPYIVAVDITIFSIKRDISNINFVTHYLNSMGSLKQVSKYSAGATRVRISRKNLEMVRIPLPPLSEQKSIAGVLSCVDLAIQKTDEVIAKTERLKKGLMKKLLTEGIGHKEFKDTPIGKMPKVWEIVVLGDVAIEVGSGLTPLGGSRTYLDYGIPLIRSQNVGMNELDFSGIAYISPETHRNMKRSTVFPRDLLLNITGASIGRVAVLPESVTEANVNQHVCRIRFSERMNSAFASFYLSSPKGQQQILSFQAGATRQGLNYQQAKLIQLPCPSLNEQREIVNILFTIMRKLKLEGENKRKIERIKQGLMDLLLSGKMRIRVD